MSSLWIVILSVLTTFLAYNFYAKRIDRSIIQPDAKRATPARMYMDGVDLMPTSRNVLFGYHFKASLPPDRSSDQSLPRIFGGGRPR